MLALPLWNYVWFRGTIGKSVTCWSLANSVMAAFQAHNLKVVVQFHLSLDLLGKGLLVEWGVLLVGG